jgi:hypothetical protein
MTRLLPRWLPAPLKAIRLTRALDSLDIRSWESFECRGARSVAVVGNAGTLGGLRLGDAIDACDLVIRLNNFRTRGFEAAVGRRTDVFLSSFFTDIDYGREELHGCRLVAAVPCAVRRNRRDAVHHRHAEHILLGMRALGRSTLHAPADSTYRSTAAELCAVPSTGFMAIRFALGLRGIERLLVTGFSFFAGGSPRHYFAGPATSGRLHDFGRERAALARLLLPRAATDGRAHDPPRVCLDPVLRGLLEQEARKRAPHREAA